MGRSQLTISDKLRKLINVSFGNFRRALMSKKQQQAFDELFAWAKNNRMAMGQATDILPIDVAFLVMMIEMKMELNALKEEMERIKNGQ